jgi:hypothetical protein
LREAGVSENDERIRSARRCAVEALGLDSEEFTEWREVESPEEGDGWSPDTNSGAEVSW